MLASCHVLLPERWYLSPAKLADVVAVRGRGGIGRDEFGGGIGTGAARLIIEPTLRTLETITPFRRCLAASVLGSGAVLDGAISEGVRVRSWTPPSKVTA